jgi:hypothetical protein
MPPGAYNLELYEGDTYSAQFVLWADAKKTQVVDVSGSTAKAEVRNAPGGNLLTTMECTVTPPNNIGVRMPASAWTSWPPNVVKGVWDLQVTYPSGDISTVVAGSVTVTADVTQ